MLTPHLSFLLLQPPPISPLALRRRQVWAVLDLLRVACLHPDANSHLAAQPQAFVLFEAALPRALAAAAAPDAPMPLQLTALRLAANLFYGNATRAQVASTPARAAALLDAAAALAANPAQPSNKHVRAAAAALAVNYGTWLGDSSSAAAAAAGAGAPAAAPAVPPSLYAGAAAALSLATASADPLHAEVRERDRRFSDPLHAAR